MNIPFNQFFKYLFKHNPNVNLKFKEERFSGDIEVSQFLTNKKERELNSEEKESYKMFMNQIGDSVRDQRRVNNLYRFISIIAFLALIIGLGFFMWLSSGNNWVIIGAAYYSFFAYLLVEAYIEASSHYFENQLYKTFNEKYLI
ncbi:hypothetical protein [Jeotgalicoccus meleagridis]|uniref:Uncharacterized protein n=1 Tax=Jeotgalicoccus meleagridis TaxID=2759181 RepID=A0A6V7R4D8_9STAP|nr:hypothetical protein [Jeotgalicoccus meleagridis]CAD2071913.1 hypothetical protein JEODO184_00471 [Jeotgalicoccus meleagridis]